MTQTTYILSHYHSKAYIKVRIYSVYIILCSFVVKPPTQSLNVKKKPGLDGVKFADTHTLRKRETL